VESLNGKGIQLRDIRAGEGQARDLGAGEGFLRDIRAGEVRKPERIQYTLEDGEA
jgi:hypothetical protein